MRFSELEKRQLRSAYQVAGDSSDTVYFVGAAVVRQHLLVDNIHGRESSSSLYRLWMLLGVWMFSQRSATTTRARERPPRRVCSGSDEIDTLPLRGPNTTCCGQSLVGDDVLLRHARLSYHLVRPG